MMSNPNYGKTESNAYAGQNPPLYSEKLLSEIPGQWEIPAEPTAPMSYYAPSSMPPQYQPSYGPPGPGFSQVQVLQPPQPMFMTTVYPVKEPDHLGYSIFTMLCCCLPIGIAALVYSIKTREANDSRDRPNAQRFSTTARTLGHTALGVGLGIILLYVIIKIIIAVIAFAASNYTHFYLRIP